MNDVHIIPLISLGIRLLGLVVILFYIIPKQFKEVVRPKSWLTGLRWQILLLFIFSILAALPALAYQYIRVNGGDSETLRNIASVTGNLSQLATIILLVLIYNYRAKE